jgi:hypothetical protein
LNASTQIVRRSLGRMLVIEAVTATGVTDVNDGRRRPAAVTNNQARVVGLSPGAQALPLAAPVRR